MTDYFANCQTHEEAKKLYRRLAFKYHPDQGGSEVEFIELGRQYKLFLERTIDNKQQSEKIFVFDKEEIIELIVQRVKMNPNIRFFALALGVDLDELIKKHRMHDSAK